MVNYYKSSVDVLFHSTAQAASKNVIAIILTGMGKAGVKGIKEFHDVGALTIAQNEVSCVIYSMPRNAVEFGVNFHILLNPQS